MLYKEKRSTIGLSALGMGIVGGMLLWWGLRRRPVKNPITAASFRPMENRFKSKTATDYSKSNLVESPTSIAETPLSRGELAPQSRMPQQATTDVSPAKSETPESEETNEPPDDSAPANPDDLTPIEGIGPKINNILHDAGINTFAQLAETEVSRLEKILREAGLSQLANASTWPEQAQLAATGNWEELKQLQDQLDAGRRR